MLKRIADILGSHKKNTVGDLFTVLSKCWGYVEYEKEPGEDT